MNEVVTVPDTFPTLFAAYTVLWVLIIGYVLYLARRLRRLEQRLEESDKTGR